MTDRRQSFEAGIRKALVDSVTLPILLFWVGLSLVPLGALFPGELGSIRYWVNVVFLLTSFWGAIGAYLVARLLMAGDPQSGLLRPGRVRLAIYATLWSVGFLSFYFYKIYN
jgi:hypothetical protein